MDIYDLCCEYVVNPLGIDTNKPRLSWKHCRTKNGDRQTAYRIRAAESEASLLAGALLWDSGKVLSSDSVAVEWGGEPLASRRRVYWDVQCWDADEVPGARSQPAWFETALLDEADWKASWIGYPMEWHGRALYFRHDIEVTKDIARARIYASGLGYQLLYMNGTQLGDDKLDPAYTDISKTVMYRTYDVTANMTSGINTIAATVGCGWHGHPRLLLQLEVYYEDGTSDIFGTESRGWIVTKGPIVASSLYSGETYDAREEMPGWNLPNTQPDARWLGSVPVPAPGGKLTAQTIDPIRIIRTMEPSSISRLQNGDYVVDFGQNIAGWVEIKLSGERGSAVRMKFAESLYKDGSVNQENLRHFPAIDTYIMKGEGEEVWEPEFTYHGFRYVQIQGCPENLQAGNIVGKLVRSSVNSAGEFSCSSELLNRIQQMVWWTEQDNYHGIPTDCPQRNERMGWLNDMTARAEMSLFNFDLSNFLPKFIDDIIDAQNPLNGGVPLTAPRGWMEWTDPMDPLSISFLEMAWLLYAHYGDKRTIQHSYSGLQRWLKQMGAQSHDYIVDSPSVADWAPPLDNILPGTMLSAAPVDLIGTGLYYYGAKLMERIAGILEDEPYVHSCRNLAEQIDRAFNDRFWDENTGGYGANNQSCNCFALWHGLVPPERIPQVMDNLVRDVVELNNTHLTTGNICTKYLLEALSTYGRADVALAIALQTNYPSWGYMLENGATTLWERWEHMVGGEMNSHNHPMMGSVSSWFYKVLAGINVSLGACAFDKFSLRPYFAPELEYVDASHDTIRGKIVSSWKREADNIIYRVQVPFGAEAEIIVAAKILQASSCTTDIGFDGTYSTLHVGSGEHQFTLLPTDCSG